MTNLDDDNLYETVIGVDGKPLRVLRDGARVRVSLMDAMAARNQLTDAERYVMQDREWRERTRANRPGFRLDISDAGKERRQAVCDAYMARDQEQAEAWRGGPSVTGAGENQFRGSQPGSKCTIDGRGGHLQMMDGELVCIPDEEMEDAMFDERESAYEAYRDHLENAYKNLR